MKLGKIKEEVCICPNCENMQYEMIRENDKFAWTCRSCGVHIENNKPFILAKHFYGDKFGSSLRKAGFFLSINRWFTRM